MWTEFPAADLAGESVATPPNSRYGWTAIRLTATDAAGNSSEFTWDSAYFSIPGGLPVGPDGRPLLTLQGAAPNPSRGGTLALVIVLPDDVPAELEVLDVGGRRITTRPVGTLGAGRHRVALPPGTALPPGMYFARLRRAGDQRVTRFVVLE